MLKFRIILITIAFALLSFMVNAQLGISLAYVNSTSPEWENQFENQGLSQDVRFLASGQRIAVDYWFRLKNIRIEFFPEISMSLQKDELDIPSESNISFGLNKIGFTFSTNIYPLDIKGDCNCPTFSKDSDFFAKGFFIQIAPGIDYYETNFKDQVKESDFAFHIGAGIGLDIGISKFITISPFVRYVFYPELVWKDLSTQILPGTQPLDTDVSSDMRQLILGIRLGFRFDELNKYGYR